MKRSCRTCVYRARKSDEKPCKTCGVGLTNHTPIRCPNCGTPCTDEQAEEQGGG